MSPDASNFPPPASNEPQAYLLGWNIVCFRRGMEAAWDLVMPAGEDVPHRDELNQKKQYIEELAAALFPSYQYEATTCQLKTALNRLWKGFLAACMSGTPPQNRKKESEYEDFNDWYYSEGYKSDSEKQESIEAEAAPLRDVAWDDLLEAVVQGACGLPDPMCSRLWLGLSLANIVIPTSLDWSELDRRGSSSRFLSVYWLEDEGRALWNDYNGLGCRDTDELSFTHAWCGDDGDAGVIALATMIHRRLLGIYHAPFRPADPFVFLELPILERQDDGRDALKKNKDSKSKPRMAARVVIDYGATSFYLKAGKRKFSIPVEYKELFALFGLKVSSGASGELVPFAELNRAVVLRDGNTDLNSSATAELRKAKSVLESRLREWASTPDGKPWITSQRRKGYGLNSSVNWIVKGASVRHSAADPLTMQRHTPARSRDDD